MNISSMDRICKIKVIHYSSPFGNLMLGAYRDRICLCDWADVPGREFVLRRLQRGLGAEMVGSPSDVTDRTAVQLDEYFAGRRQEFDIPLLFVGTEFQESVWSRLLEVGFGKTVSYGELARMVGRPRAVRAVAAANRANALSVIVPCHRVIGGNGSLTGYAGGLAVKMSLLALESRLCGPAANYGTDCRRSG